MQEDPFTLLLLCQERSFEQGSSLVQYVEHMIESLIRSIFHFYYPLYSCLSFLNLDIFLFSNPDLQWRNKWFCLDSVWRSSNRGWHMLYSGHNSCCLGDNSYYGIQVRTLILVKEMNDTNHCVRVQSAHAWPAASSRNFAPHGWGQDHCIWMQVRKDPFGELIFAYLFSKSARNAHSTKPWPS